tara:strand:+ start:4981 stop:6516 length:1536 start_codon:yes stop_codon:yes gene_type:complete
MTYIITTPLYYVNDKPHLGSLYTTIISDAIARYKRLRGEKVIFITGVDEHGLKIQRTAQENGITPEEHCNEVAKVFKDNWKKWNISFDKFIRTTSKHHKSIVNEFYKRVKESDDIYMGVQKGWYCVGCEEFKENPDDSPNFECPIHKKALEWKNEENLFFRLSKYQKEIEKLLDDHNFIEPKDRRKEIINFVSKGLKDFSISRTNLKWGISIPGEKDHTFYVWFDALLGYVSAISLNESNQGTLEDSISNGWPINLHLIGKDILRFHAVYWPAMLLSAGIKPPEKVLGHGFLTREGMKMGKSLGNVLDPNNLLAKYGEERVRWFLLKDIYLGSDGDFQDRRFVDIVNNDLANTIGNLLNRTTSMSRKWFEDSVPNDIDIKDNYFVELSKESIDNYISNFEKYNLSEACNQILNFAIKINLYLNEEQPWILIKDKKNHQKVKQVIYNVLEANRLIALLLQPILSNLSNKILKQLGISYYNRDNWTKNLEWGLLNSGNKLPQPIPIIEKIEYE